MGQPIGRLLVVLDMEMKPETALTIRNVVENWKGEPQTTFISGLTRSVVMGHGNPWPQVFYNAYEFIPLMEVMSMLPWLEVWVVAAGHAWQAGPLLGKLDTPKKSSITMSCQRAAEENWVLA